MTGTDIVVLLRKTNRRLSKLLLLFLILIPAAAALYVFDSFPYSLAETIGICAVILFLSVFPFFAEKYSSNELWTASCCLYCLEILLLMLSYNSFFGFDVFALFLVMPIVSMMYLNRSILQKMVAVGFGGMLVVKIALLVSSLTIYQVGEQEASDMYYDLFLLSVQYIILTFVMVQVFVHVENLYNGLLDEARLKMHLESDQQKTRRYEEAESAEKFILDGEAYDVRQLFNSVDSDIQKLIEGKDKAFTLDVDRNLPVMLFGRKTQLKNALSNIISDLLMYQTNSAVSVYVTYDSGINPKKKQNITLIIHIDSNVLLDKAAADKTVLGYYLSQNIIKDLHGSFSEMMDGGQMSFRICVLQRVENEMTLAERQNMQISELHELKQRAIATKGVDSVFHSKVNILVVDDNKETRKLLDSVISAMGINVTCANNGVECIELIKSKEYHMLIIDQMMPDKSGTETVKEIRFMDDEEDDYFQKLPIVMMSVRSKNDSNMDYQKQGFTDCISKPIKTGEVKACIFNWIKVERLMSYEEYMRMHKNDET